MAAMPGLGTREGAPLVPEQMTFDQITRNGGAIDGDERFLGARRDLMNETRRDLLADATLPGYQERAVDIGDSPEQQLHLAHCLRVAERALRLMRRHEGAQLRCWRQNRV
jgi:hypothetical protein